MADHSARAAGGDDGPGSRCSQACDERNDDDAEDRHRRDRGRARETVADHPPKDGEQLRSALDSELGTTTLELRIPYRQTNTILRLEHRYDDSRGPDGGFFKGAEVKPGLADLTPTQHLLIFSVI